MSTSTCRCAGSVTPYFSSIWLRQADLVGALPVSIRDRVEGATPSWAATSSSLYPLDSRSLRSSVPRRRRLTVGPVVIADPPPSGDVAIPLSTLIKRAAYLMTDAG